MALSIQPRHLLRLAAGAMLTLVLANCGSDGGTDDASATSLPETDAPTATTESSSATAAPPETDPPETDPPETDPPETDPPETDPLTDSSSSDVCESWETLGGFVGMLVEPAADTDFEAVWDSIQEVASEMTQNAPEGYEDELARMEQAWGEFRVAAREHDFDHDAAEDDFDQITENLDLDDPEIVAYLATEC